MAEMHWSEILQNLTLSAAAVGAGVWALYRFWVERQNEAALNIHIRKSIHKATAGCDIFVDVALTNTGKSKVQAHSERPAYQDRDETLEFPCSLQVREVIYGGSKAAYCDWYDPSLVGVVNGIPAIDLATAFENPAEKATEFWIEPGETVHLGAMLVLPPGRYLLKVTFVGPIKSLTSGPTSRL